MFERTVSPKDRRVSAGERDGALRAVIDNAREQLLKPEVCSQCGHKVLAPEIAAQLNEQILEAYKHLPKRKAGRPRKKRATPETKRPFDIEV